MPGLRYGNDITDTAQQMRDIGMRLREQINVPNLSKAKRGTLENAIRANDLAIKEMFGSTRTMNALAKWSKKDMPDVEGPNGQKFRPALPKHLHRRVTKGLGVEYERKGTKTLVGKTDADSYTARGKARPTIQGGLETARAEKRKRDRTIGRRDRRQREKQRKAGGA